MLSRSQIPGLPLQTALVMGLCVLSGLQMPAVNAQSPTTLKAFSTQPHVGPVEQALVGIETRIASTTGPPIFRHGNGLLLPEPLSSEHQVTLVWSRWDEASQHFQPPQKRLAELAAIKPQTALLNRLAFAHAEDIPSSGAVVVEPEGMGVGLITSAVKSAISAFSTFATLNTTTNCISPQSIPDDRLRRCIGLLGKTAQRPQKKVFLPQRLRKCRQATNWKPA